MATAEDFRKALLYIFAKNNGDYVDVRAGDLYILAGGKGGPNRMPSCVSVMRAQKNDDDEIIAGPPSGIGPNLVVRYKLPRPLTPGIEAPAANGVSVIGTVANVHKGRDFQSNCKDAFERMLRRKMEVEVSLPGLGGKLHKFDLATSERDVVVECKAFNWTSSGNIPSAKITTLREAVQYLRSIQRNSESFLVISTARLPGKAETLGQYFVRLNKDMTGNVNVLEMPLDGGDVVCLRGSLPSAGGQITLLS